MAQAKKLVPAASRSWLTYGLVALALVVGSVLLYRYVAGSTLKEIKAANLKEKEARELGSKTPGNAEAFSTRLENKRKDIEEEEAKLRGAAPAATVDPATDKTVKPAGSMPSGKLPADTPTDTQLDAYARLKEENLQAQSRKLSSWEAPSERLGGAQAGGLEQLLAQAGVGQGSAATTTPKTSGSSALVDAYLKVAQGQGGATAGKDTQFMKGLESKGVNTPLIVQASPGRNSLLEGTAIPIVMRTAVSSDLPGPCRAAVEQDVYDSITQSIKLIPAGASVLCAYNSEVAVGQDRLLLGFTRMIFPNGTSVALGGMEGADEQGKVGAKADVNTRFLSRFGSSLMIAGISTLTQGILPIGSGTTINMPGSSSSGAGTQALGEVAKKSFERNLNIKEELSLSPGDRLRMIVTRDMVLDPAITHFKQ